jgi:hypothetical protein
MEFSFADSMTIMLQLAMGLSLAACAGIRAFLPLLIVGLAGRFDVIPLLDSFDWLASTPALTVFGIAVVVEILADKIPLIDHLLDSIQTGVKPVAGTVVVAGLLTEFTPLQSVVLGIVLGGSAAGAVHVLKAKARVLSSVTTGGMANPVISTIEDAGTLTASVAAIFMPLIVLTLMLSAVAGTGIALGRLRRRRALVRGVGDLEVANAQAGHDQRRRHEEHKAGDGKIGRYGIGNDGERAIRDLDRQQ